MINCSWRTSGDHTGIRTAIQNAVSSNVVVVFAAGNANVNTDMTPEYPGIYPQVLAVAALDQRGLKASFSNFGTNVDVAHRESTSSPLCLTTRMASSTEPRWPRPTWPAWPPWSGRSLHA